MVSFRCIRKLSKILILLLLVISTVSVLIPTASAAGDDAEFNSIDLTATPQVQGMGGEIVIRVQANFFGGCCYHLYAYDITPELVLPDNVKIIGSLPGSVSKVDAQPGGQATSESFTWKVSSSEPGTYDLEVTVRTSNSGSLTEIITITVTEGASVSNPDIYPNEPSVDEEISISVEVKSGRDEVKIEQTDMYILASKNEYDITKLVAKNETLYINENTDTNLTQAKLKELDAGKLNPMTPVDFSDKWRSKLPGFSDETEVYLWFVVKNSDGQNTTSSVYNLKIEDLEQRELILSSVIWLTISGVIVGSILIFVGWMAVTGKTEKTKGKKGLMTLGGKFREEPYKADTPQVIELQQRLETARFIVMLFLVIIAIAFIIWAIYAGLFTELFNRTVEG
jgi:hypothetical protein